MADDNYIVTVILKLDPGDTGSEAEQAGKQISDKLSSSIKPQIDLSKAFKVEGLEKTIAVSYQNAFKGTDLTKAIEDAFSKVDISHTDFGKHLEKALHDVAKQPRHAPEIIPPQRREEAGPSPAQRLQPLVSGLEAVSMLMRGAPLLSVAQMAGQALTGFEAQRRAAAERVVEAKARADADAKRAAVEAKAEDEAEEARVRTSFRKRGPGGKFQAGTTAPPEEIDQAVASALAVTAAKRAAIPPIPPVGGGGGMLAGIGGIGGLVGGGLAIGGGILAIVEAAKAIEEMGEKSAATNQELQDMADTMSVSTRQLFKTRAEFAGSNVDLDTFSRSLTRLAITARERMPEIEHAVAVSSDHMEEANIKVRESHRAIEKAMDDRQEATERVNKAEGELVKFEATGAETRAQQARAAELGVSGAQIGLRGAQMQQRRAAIGLQFAPEEQRLADVQGPLTVEGAKLGARGAGIAAEEAGARYRRFMYGEEEDPQVAEQRNIRKEQLMFDTARHNKKQADARVEDAQVAEQKRQTLQAAGLGPVGQAQQQALEAAQNEAQSRLRVQQATTAQKNLQIDQAFHPLAERRNQLQRDLNETNRGVMAAADQEIRARAAEHEARLQLGEIKYREIGPAKEAVEAAEKGEPTPGYDLSRIPQETLKNIFIQKGGGKVGGIQEQLQNYLQMLGRTMGEEAFPEQLRVVQGVLPQRGYADTAKLTRALSKTEAERTPEERELIEHSKTTADMSKEQLKKSQELNTQVGVGKERVFQEKLATGFELGPLAAKIEKLGTELSVVYERGKQGLGGFANQLDESTTALGRWKSKLEESAPPERTGAERRGGRPKKEQIEATGLPLTPEEQKAKDDAAKAEAAKADAAKAEADAAKTAKVVKPVEAAKPAEAEKPAEVVKPAETAVPGQPTPPAPVPVQPTTVPGKPGEQPKVVPGTAPVAAVAPISTECCEDIKKLLGKQDQTGSNDKLKQSTDQNSKSTDTAADTHAQASSEAASAQKDNTNALTGNTAALHNLATEFQQGKISKAEFDKRLKALTAPPPGAGLPEVAAPPPGTGRESGGFKEMRKGVWLRETLPGAGALPPGVPPGSQLSPDGQFWRAPPVPGQPSIWRKITDVPPPQPGATKAQPATTGTAPTAAQAAAAAQPPTPEQPQTVGSISSGPYKFLDAKASKAAANPLAYLGLDVAGGKTDVETGERTQVTQPVSIYTPLPLPVSIASFTFNGPIPVHLVDASITLIDTIPVRVTNPWCCDAEGKPKDGGGGGGGEKKKEGGGGGGGEKKKEGDTGPEKPKGGEPDPNKPAPVPEPDKPAPDKPAATGEPDPDKPLIVAEPPKPEPDKPAGNVPDPDKPKSVPEPDKPKVTEPTPGGGGERQPEEDLPPLEMLSPKDIQRRWPHGAPSDPEIESYKKGGGKGLPPDEWLQKQRGKQPEQQKKEKTTPDTEPPDRPLIEKPGAGASKEDEEQQTAAIEAEQQRQQEEQQRQEEEQKREEEQQQEEQLVASNEGNGGGGNGGGNGESESLATGGPVGGWGSGKSDSVPIMASKGEYVVTADGSNLNDAIQHFTGMAAGGPVTKKKQQTKIPFEGDTENAIALGMTYAGASSDEISSALGGYQQGLQALSGGYAGGGVVGEAISHLVRGFARGGLVGGFTDTVAHIPGYASGGPVATKSSGPSTLSSHQLDLRTNAGNFSASVSEDTMGAIRNSSLNGKLTQTGQKPSWYS